MKPVINLDEIKDYKQEKSGKFESSYAGISNLIGAVNLGYNITIVPPGKTSCPFHNHRINEELFIILEGNGTLRFGEKEFALRANDFIACPPGEREVAHQIINTGKTDLKYLGISTSLPYDICEYPDSNKIMSFDKLGLRHMSFSHDSVDYLAGEDED